MRPCIMWPHLGVAGRDRLSMAEVSMIGSNVTSVESILRAIIFTGPFRYIPYYTNVDNLFFFFWPFVY